jgi:glycerol transport system ATP-binding protein
MDEGRLLQVGPTLEVYNSPASERVGQVFSDPQMSLLDVEVSATEARMSPEVALPLTGHLKALTPGRYRLGLRAHHLRLAPVSGADVRIPARVEVEEVSGSETIVHATHGKLSLTAFGNNLAREREKQPWRLDHEERREGFLRHVA